MDPFFIFLPFNRALMTSQASGKIDFYGFPQNVLVSQLIFSPGARPSNFHVLQNAFFGEMVARSLGTVYLGSLSLALRVFLICRRDKG